MCIRDSVQAANAVGQLLGQHGHHLIGVVDAGSAVKGLVVQLGACLLYTSHFLLSSGSEIKAFTMYTEIGQKGDTFYRSFTNYRILIDVYKRQLATFQLCLYGHEVLFLV